MQQGGFVGTSLGGVAVSVDPLGLAKSEKLKFRVNLRAGKQGGVAKRSDQITDSIIRLFAFYLLTPLTYTLLYPNRN